MAEKHKHGKLREYVKLLLYAASLLKVTRPHLSNPHIYAAKKTSKNKLQLSIRRVSLRIFETLTNPLTGFEPDLNSDVFISERNAIIYGLRNGGWHHVFFFGSKDIGGASKDVNTTAKRWIRVNVSSDLDSNQCLLSPILFHNIQQNINDGGQLFLEFDDAINILLHSDPVKRVLTLWKNAYCFKERFQHETAIQRSPKKASEVHVQVVESPKYKCGSEIELLLSDIFSVPKAATAGDILSLSIPSHLAYEFSTSTSIIPPKYIFIKISSIQNEQDCKIKETVLIDTEATSLYLVGNTHSFLPPLFEDFDENGELDVPPVLRKTLSRVNSVLKSELHEIKFASSSGSTDVRGKKSLRSHKEPPKNSSGLSAVAQRDTGSKFSREVALEREHIASRANILMLGSNGSGNEQILELLASSLGLCLVWADCWHLKGDTSGSTEARLRQTFSKAAGQGPCILALTNVHSISKDRDGGEDARVVAALKEEVAKLPDLQPPVFVIATAPSRTLVSGDLWSIWSHQEHVDTPDLGERRQMFEWLLSKWLQKHQIQNLAQRTAGYVYGDMQALINAAQRHHLSHLQMSEKGDNVPRGRSSVTYEDVVKALDELQSSRSEALGAPRIPQVKWNEVGGLEEAKREVINTIQLPLRHPSLVSSRLRRSGVLLYGPPGTGKTLLAKAVATECGLNFLSVKGPELLNMYVGQSEENVRQVFSKARAAAPCIIFFDELDSLAPNRGRSGDSGGVMDRIVSALLAELDGVSSSADVFVLAATNRPDLIDPALLRPGRFEKLVFLGVCEERAGQIKILQAVTSKIPLRSDVSLVRVAELLPLTLTGADIYALCTDALYTALHRITNQIAEGQVDKEDAEVLVAEEDFTVAAINLVPSVTPFDLAYYRSLNAKKQR